MLVGHLFKKTPQDRRQLQLQTLNYADHFEMCFIRVPNCCPFTYLFLRLDVFSGWLEGKIGKRNHYCNEWQTTELFSPSTSFRETGIAKEDRLRNKKEFWVVLLLFLRSHSTAAPKEKRCAVTAWRSQKNHAQTELILAINAAISAAAFSKRQAGIRRKMAMFTGKGQSLIAPFMEPHALFLWKTTLSMSKSIVSVKSY